MVLQNHSLNQDKLFKKILRYRTLFCLPCTGHVSMLSSYGIFASDISKT